MKEDDEDYDDEEDDDRDQQDLPCERDGFRVICGSAEPSRLTHLLTSLEKSKVFQWLFWETLFVSVQVKRRRRSKERDNFVFVLLIKIKNKYI